MDAVQNMNRSWIQTTDKKRSLWSYKEIVTLVDILDNMGRCKFTDEDYEHASNMMLQFGLQRSPQQCCNKFNEMKRCHISPKICKFFEKILSKKQQRASRGGVHCSNTPFPAACSGAGEERRDEPQGTSEKKVVVLDIEDFMETTQENERASSHSIFGPYLNATPQKNCGESSNSSLEPEVQVIESDIESDEGDKMDLQVSQTPARRKDKESRIRKDDDEDREKESIKKACADKSGVVLCPKCQSDVMENHLFCSFCGHNLERSRCRKCNHKLMQNAKFCCACGCQQSQK